MSFQIEQEWASFTRTYEELRHVYEGACRRVNSFRETPESVSLLEQRKAIEAQLGKIAEAITACDEVHDDMIRFSKIHDVVMKHNEDMQKLEGKIAFAEMYGLTPESPTPKAKELRTKSKKGFKMGNRLKNEVERINHRFLNGYYNSRINKANEVLKPFYEQFSWFWRLIIRLSFCWKVDLKPEEVEHLSWRNFNFLVGVQRTKLWLSKWAAKLQQDLKNARDQWQEAKDLLERQQEEALVVLKRHTEEEVLWARRDPERIAKYLEGGRADQGRVLDCLSPSVPDTSQVKEVEDRVAPIKKKVRTRPEHRKHLAPKFVKQDPGGPRWKLFVCDDRLKREIELPDPADESFITFLAKAFTTLGYCADPDDVAKSLRKIVSYTSESLRRHKRVSYGEPKGWKIFRCGRFRILMDIAEVPQEKLVKGTFIVRYRPDAYPQ